MEGAELAALPVILRLFLKLAQIQLQPFLLPKAQPVLLPGALSYPSHFSKQP